MLNQHHWTLYKNSPDNQIQLFENLLAGHFEYFKENFLELLKAITPDRDLLDAYAENIGIFLEFYDAFADDIDGEPLIPDYDHPDYPTLFAQISREMNFLVFDEDEELSPRQILRDLCYNIPNISLILSLLQPELFFPYFFTRNFLTLQRIFDFLEIEMPPVPLKNQYYERAFYYETLCRQVLRYRMAHHLTPAEMYAIIYHLVPLAINCNDFIQTDLPAPRRAFFIGGGKNSNGDPEYLAHCSQKEIFSWQANDDGECGDIVLLYLLAPHSEIAYIARTVSETFADPYFYYYKCTFVSRLQPLPKLPLSQMKKDPILSEMPLVKANMQGINGRIIAYDDYLRIHDLLQEKGMKPKQWIDLPTIKKEIPPVQNEYEVERKIILPLLKEMGYAPDDITEKPTIRMGSGLKQIPDFLIGYQTQGAYHSADIVIEAKLSIPTKKQLRIHAGQGCSYARSLLAKYMLLISREGVWVYSEKDYFVTPIWHCEWSQYTTDEANRLYSYIGK